MVFRKYLCATALLMSCSDKDTNPASDSGVFDSFVSSESGAPSDSTTTNATGETGALDSHITTTHDAATGAIDATSQPDTASPRLDSGSARCTSPTIRITEIDVGKVVSENESDATLRLLSLSPIPSGGTRVAFLSTDKNVHVRTLDTLDALNTAVPEVQIPTDNDYSDMWADNSGGVVLLTRFAKGAGAQHCGTVTNLCGATANLPTNVACYDMYLVRFDGTQESWATALTNSASVPPYLTSPASTANSHFVWWYAHHGRITSDGTNYAAFFGSAIGVSETCGAGSAIATGVNIHQGDRMKVVGPTGTLLAGHDSFDWGCSHSGYERIVWDSRTSHFKMVCKNDRGVNSTWNGRIADPAGNWVNSYVYAIDLWYSELGNLVLGTSSGYWLTTSHRRSGQPAAADGLADVHLLHFTSSTNAGVPDIDRNLTTPSALNARAPHLATYGSKYLLAAWETSTQKGSIATNDASRKMSVQVLSATDGLGVSAPIEVAVRGNRYQEFRSFPDGSVAYVAPGSSNTKLKIVRVMPCE